MDGLFYFLLCGATMEAAAGMPIHSTALRPIDMAQIFGIRKLESLSYRVALFA